MATLAPRLSASATFRAPPAVATTVAPALRPTWTSRLPSPPAAASISTRSPGRSAARSLISIAVRPSASSATATSIGVSVGTSMSPSASTATRSAYPPDPPVVVMTRRPTRDESKSGPTDSTVPPTPLPRMVGSAGFIAWFGGVPARTCVSTYVTLAYSTATTTCPGPASGSGTSSIVSRSGGPKSRKVTARIGNSSASRQSTSIIRDKRIDGDGQQVFAARLTQGMMAPVEVPPISTAARASARTQDSSRRHSADGPVGPELSVFVEAARDGDERAFRSLYRAVQPGLLRYLRVLVGDEAEDVASEAWLQIVRDFASFQGDGDDFRAWSATVARHRALDHLRARPRVPQQAVSLDVLGDQPATSDTAASAIDALSTTSAIALIAKLPREQAEAVLLRVVVGLDAVAAARVLGKRAGAVRTSAYRGLRRLQHLVAEANGDATAPSDAEPPPRAAA